MIKEIRQIFLNGLKVFLPIVITFAIVIWIFYYIELFFGNIIRIFIPDRYYFDGLGIIIGVLFVFILGVLLRAWIITKLYKLAEKFVKKIPLVKTIYGWVKDLLTYFEKAQTSEEHQAVVVRFGKLRLLGFITRESFQGLPPEFGDNDHVLVYLPMSYQIGGYMLSIPRDRVTPINLKVNKALPLIITAGMSGVD
ncbi:MAG TPA: DUF502 domain-containing protein, partial [Gammaproteobacteria bacterium]|nr:DUF502 domain-containing protein [Gammaproteobacteria bacterium]